MRLLVLGANGLLGSQVVSTALDRDWSVVGTYRSARPAFDTVLHRLDLRDVDQFDTHLDRVEPDWVVNCAAMTDVDACELEPEHAHEVNGRAAGAMAELCREGDIGFCHVSTDYVFDGESDTPYFEDDERNPVQTYGESKLAGERAVLDANESAILVRLSFVYGIRGATRELTGFPAWVREELRTPGELPLFDDQWVTPTRAGQAAETMLDLAESSASGTFHVASRSCVTPFDFGRQILERMADPVGTLVRGSMTAVDRPARRPSYSCLDVAKVERELARPQPTLEADLNAISEFL